MYKKIDLLKLILALGIAGFYLYVFLLQISFILDLNLLHAQQEELFPYHQFMEPELFKNDYIASFLQSGNRPILYHFFTLTWLFLGGDLLVFHDVMPLALWILLLTSASLAGWKLNGALGSAGAFALVLTQPLFLYQITSALPHAFAFPLLGWTIVALLYADVKGLIALSLLSAALYPPITPIIGLSLCGQLFLLKKKFQVSTFPRIITIAVTTGCLSILLGAVVLSPKTGFGRPIAPLQEVEQFPENGVQGRYGRVIDQPTVFVLVKIINQVDEMLDKKLILSLMILYLLLTIRGYFSISRSSRNRSEMTIYVASSLITIAFFFLFKPAYVYRFILYSFLILSAILVPTAIINLSKRCKKEQYTIFLPLILIFLFTLIYDSNHQSKIGYSSEINPESRKILNFIVSTPVDTLIAGWPDTSLIGEINEKVPYIAKRPVLIHGKVHMANYQGYLMEMRKRMYALTDAYSANDVKPIRQLQDKYGVDYLLVDKRYFQENSAPGYFAPFDKYIDKVWDSRRKKGFILATHGISGKVLETENYMLININEFLKASDASIKK